MPSVTLRKIEDEVGAAIPADVLNRLCLREGDVLDVIDTEQGIFLRAKETAFAREHRVAELVMDQNRLVLKALAK